MGKSAQALNNEIKNHFYDAIETLLTNNGEEVHRVPLNDTGTVGYKLALPVVDSEGNEKSLLIELKIPKGSRTGEAYDLYAEADRYADNVEEHKKKADAREAKSRAAQEERKRKDAERAAKKAEKEAAKAKEAGE